MKATLYRFFNTEGVLIYVGSTTNLSSRISHHKNNKDWFGLISLMRIERFPSKSKAHQAEVRAIKSEKPLFNIYHNRPKLKRRTFSLNDDDWSLIGKAALLMGFGKRCRGKVIVKLARDNINNKYGE